MWPLLSGRQPLIYSFTSRVSRPCRQIYDYDPTRLNIWKFLNGLHFLWHILQLYTCCYTPAADHVMSGGCLRVCLKLSVMCVFELTQFVLGVVRPHVVLCSLLFDQCVFSFISTLQHKTQHWHSHTVESNKYTQVVQVKGTPVYAEVTFITQLSVPMTVPDMFSSYWFHLFALILVWQ